MRNRYAYRPLSCCMDRRTFLATFGAGAVAGLAGCAALGSDGDLVEDAVTIDVSDGDHSESEFRDVVDDRHDTHGASGVWGRAESEPDHDLAFEGAWTQTLEHSTGVQSEHVLVIYRLPGGPNGRESAQVWLWSGADPAESGTLRRLETSVSLPEDASLGIYSPAQDYRASDVDDYDVESGRLDVATLSATIPLPSGTVGVDAEQTRIGDGGGYAPYWEGGSDAARSLAATTELRRPALDGAELTWTVGVDATS